jgi:hypothetical protein
MADDFSLPRAIPDPAVVITDVYAFPSPGQPGLLVLVLNVFPAAAPAALFSDAIDYRFRVRPVAPTRAGAAPAFEVGADEYAFTVSFAAPPASGGDTTVQAGTCTAPRGHRISFRVGDHRVPEASGLRAFAGPRLDPSFTHSVRNVATVAREGPPFRPAGAGALEGQNVLSIVLEVDAATVFGPGSGPLLAIVGETVTRGRHPVRVGRMGRAGIRNFIVSPEKSASVDGDLETSELYSVEDAFSLRPDCAGTCRSRLNATLAYFDRPDGRVDWPRDDQGSHPLTALLLADFLLVDVSKPWSEDGCFEIETAMLAGRAHKTCGGRSPKDSILDTIYTLLVGGVGGARIGDGVDQATRSAACAFPYLASPAQNPPDLLTAIAAQPASAAEPAP